MKKKIDERRKKNVHENKINIIIVKQLIENMTKKNM